MNNNDLRSLIDRLDHIDEGELGRKIGSTIGGVFGNKGAKIGGDLGDKAGDFLDKFNPFSKSKDKDTATNSGNSRVNTSQDFAPPTTSTSFTGSNVPDNKVSSGTNVVGSGITGHGTGDDIENVYAANPARFRIAQNWKDGQPLDPNGITYTNGFTKKKLPQDILHIEARKGWDKPMVNFDGSPIIAGDAGTKPKEPDHPYYHLIDLKRGERIDAGARFELRQLLEKDQFGYQRHDIKSSRTPAIEWTVPNGFSTGGQEILRKQIYAGTPNRTIACYQKGSSIIWVEKRGEDRSLSYDNASMIGMTVSAKEVEAWEKQLKSSVSVKHVNNGLSVSSQVGQWSGYSVRASGGRYGSDGVRADILNQIPCMQGDNVVQDMYSFTFFGPFDDWKSGGQNALMQIAASSKYAEGFSPIRSKSMDESLRRIVKLAWH